MRWLVGVVVGFSLSCNCGQSPSCVNGFAVRDTPLFEVGVPYRGRVGFLAACRDATSVRGTLVDSDNLPVQFSASLGDGATVDLSFTPLSAGPHHLDLVVEPNLGRVQADLISGVRRSRAQRSMALPSPANGCRPAHLTSRGRLVCGQAMGTAAVYVVNDGGLEQALPLNGVTAVGDVMWTEDRGELQRWEEGPAGFVPSAARPGGLSGLSVLAATERYAFMADTNRVNRVSFEDGGWSVEQFEVPMLEATYGAGVLSGVATGSMSSDGGAWWSPGARPCLNPVARDGGQRCFESPVQVAFTEPGAAWFQASGVIGRISEEGAVSVLPLPANANGLWAPLILNIDQWAIAAESGDGGLHWEILGDGGWYSGWVDGASIYLFTPGRLDVLER